LFLDHHVASICDLSLLIRDYRPIGRVGNIIALLERSDLVRRISQVHVLVYSSRELEDIWEAMPVPFPELTHLMLHHYVQTEPVLPLSDTFLGGSAPRLRSLKLDGIPYPGLPKLLLSATHLTSLYLGDIPEFRVHSTRGDGRLPLHIDQP
jgi:hypothetical protein